jgi:hypothetical protein
MGLKRFLYMPLNSGVSGGAAAGTKMTFQLQKALRYSRLDIIYLDGTGAPVGILNLFTDVELLKNNKTFRIHSTYELDHLNSVNGSQYAAANLTTGAGATLRQVLPIFFQEPWRKNLAQADSMAINVDPSYGWTTFSLNLTLAVALPANAQVILLAYVDPIVALASGQSPTQMAKQVLRFDLPASGTQNDYDQLPGGWYYQAIYFKNPSGGGGYITDVILKQDGTLVRDKVLNTDNITAMVGAGLNPGVSQAAGGFGYDLVLDWDDPINSTLGGPGATSPWIHVDYSAAAAGNTRILAEVLGPLQN